jgi:tryptophanyl-tRNA synthetase
LIEKTGDIARLFTRLYGETLVAPEALLSTYPRLPGVDGRQKMSKSLGNTIDLSDSADVVRRKIMKMFTDPSRIHSTDPGHVLGNPVFVFHDAFNPDRQKVEELKERYEKGKVGDVEVKQQLVLVLNDLLEPMRKRRAAYQQDLATVYSIIKNGTSSARESAGETLAAVRRALHLEYFTDLPG